MKRYISIALLFALLLCGCAQNAVPTEHLPSWQEQYDLGMRYLTEGNYEEAILAFTAAIQIDGKRPESFAGRADAYMGKAGELDIHYRSEEIASLYGMAESDFLSSLGLDESQYELYEKLADIYIAMGDIDKAIEILQLGYDRTQNEKLLERKALLEELPDDIPKGSLIVSMYGASGAFLGHDAYAFDPKGRMTSNLWYDENNEVLYAAIWEYDDEAGVTVSIIDDVIGDADAYYGSDSGTEEFNDVEDHGWYWEKMTDPSSGEGREELTFASPEEEEQYWSRFAFCTDPRIGAGRETITMENGNTARFSYDSLGRTISIHTYTPEGDLVGYCVITNNVL